MLTRNNKVIYLILILGLILRLIVINQSLWLDEAIGALAARDFSYGGILTNFMHFDNHPPLYYLTLRFWTDIFGYSEISLRMPSVLFGVATIYFVYLISKKITYQSPTTNSISLFSAILLATSQFHIYYSQEARMYSMATFFSTLSIYAFLFIVESTKKLKYWVIFSIATTTLIFTDYMPVFLLPVFFVYPIFRKKDWQWWKKYFLTFVPILFLGFLWLPTLLIQFSKGKWLLETLPSWKNVAGGATLKQLALVWTKFSLGRITFLDKYFYYSLIFVASTPFIIALFRAFTNTEHFNARMKRTQRNKLVEPKGREYRGLLAIGSLFSALRKGRFLLIWLWLTIPLLLGFIVSFLFPAFIYFRYLYIVPAFYLLVSIGVQGFRKKIVKVVLMASLLFVNIFSYFVYILDPHQQREMWREATQFVEDNAKDAEIIIFEFTEPFAPYKWYARGLVAARGVTDSISANPESTSQLTSDTIKDKKGVYYFEYLRDLSDPQRVVEGTLKNQGFSVNKIYNYVGVGQIYYWTR